MRGDESYDPGRCALRAGELGAASRVVEVASERGVASREPRTNAWREAAQEHAGDAMPEQRPRRLRPVVQEPGGHQLVVRAERAKDPRGLARVPLVGTGRAEIPSRLLNPVEQG